MVYRLSRCELDPARFELRHAGEAVQVEPQVLELLLYLITHRDRVVTRAELFENLWRGRVVTDSALNSRIKAARAAIGDDGASQSEIRTLHRMGYRFVGPVEEIPDASDAAAEPEGAAEGVAERAMTEAAPAESPAVVPALATSPVIRPAPSRRLGFAGAAFGIVLAASAAALLPRTWLDTGVPGASNAVAPAPAAGTTTLAVLPFTNLSPDDEQDYFAQGIGEELLIVLSRLPDLQVTGRVSAARFKERNQSLQAVGETLGVGYLLTGSVRKSGDRMRIVVELADAASGYQLWSESYDRQLGDVLEVQDEIAGDVATALKVKLGLGESGELSMTRNVAAYDEFLRGYARYVEFQPETIALAVEHMQRAIALDPEFARAWAYLYCIYRDLPELVPARAEEWLNKSLEALARANALAPDSPFVATLNAREDMRLGRLLDAKARLEALPGGYWTADRYVTRDVFLARWSIGTGHAREAIEVLERARAADPLSPVIARYFGVAYANAGDAERSFAASGRERELGGSLPTLTRNALFTALGTGNRAEIERRVAALPQDTAGHRAISEALVRYLDDALAARKELRRLAAEASAPDVVRSSLLAHWAAYYGDTEIALAELEKIGPSAVDNGLLWRPVLGKVRRLDGFKHIVRNLGLVDYWQAYGWPDFCRPKDGGDFECA